MNTAETITIVILPLDSKINQNKSFELRPDSSAVSKVRMDTRCMTVFSMLVES